MDIEKSVRKSCRKMQKKVLKVSKKLFKIDTFPLLFQAMFEQKEALECKCEKDVRDFTNEDIMANSYGYAKYKTMKRLCDIYMDFTQFITFDLHDVMEDIWTQESLNG